MFGATLVGAAPALAADRDERIAVRLFDPGTIVSLHGRPGIQSTVAFGPGEHIENVAVGDSAAWQVTPNKRADLLFVKPTAPRARTNMTVVTDQHTYLFDLMSAAGGPATYMLRFTYPAPPRSPVKPASAATAAKPPASAASPATPSAGPAALNFAWEARGDKALVPARWFDDGRHIYLAWSRDAGLPAILVRASNGAEGPVNSRVEGDYVVVEGVPTQLVLRLGKQIAMLTQLHPIAPPAVPPDAPARLSFDETASVRTASAQP